MDVTRLLARRHSHAPTGIDRVDLAYATHYLSRPGSEAVAATRWGVRVVPKGTATKIVGELARHWLDRDGTHESRAAAVRLRRWLAGRPGGGPTIRAGGVAVAHTLDQSALSLGSIRWRRPENVAARGATYLYTSHLLLDQPGHFAWLDGRPDIRPVFFVHDLIPIDFPEYSGADQAERHRARMETVIKRGAAFVTATEHVAGRFAALASREGWPDLPGVTAPLGTAAPFTSRPAPFPASRPYLVVCGTLEPRKNHLLLLQVWRDLAIRLGPGTPALVIAGRRGWKSEATLDLLDRCPALVPHVLEVSGLGTTDLARLIAGARALLMPSFAEGFGMPVVEAMSLGTPVIASDIPTHREVTRAGRARLVHPLDGPGWRAAVIEAATAAGPDRAAAGTFRPPTWSGHFAAVERFLAGVADPGLP